MLTLASLAASEGCNPTTASPPGQTQRPNYCGRRQKSFPMRASPRTSGETARTPVIRKTSRPGKGKMPSSPPCYMGGQATTVPPRHPSATPLWSSHLDSQHPQVFAKSQAWMTPSKTKAFSLQLPGPRRALNCSQRVLGPQRSTRK